VSAKVEEHLGGKVPKSNDATKAQSVRKAGHGHTITEKRIESVRLAIRWRLAVGEFPKIPVPMLSIGLWQLHVKLARNMTLLAERHQENNSFQGSALE
jgi:hypothetical protein